MINLFEGQKTVNTIKKNPMKKVFQRSNVPTTNKNRIIKNNIYLIINNIYNMLLCWNILKLLERVGTVFFSVGAVGQAKMAFPTVLFNINLLKINIISFSVGTLDGWSEKNTLT